MTARSRAHAVAAAEGAQRPLGLAHAGTRADRHPFRAAAVVWVAFALSATFALAQPLSGWHRLSSLSAWTGCSLVCVSLLLMVREAHLARWLGGLEAMYRWHHRSGALGYVLLLVHPLALAAAGWLESPPAAWRAIAPSASWPVALGWLALIAMMIGLAGTFSLDLPYRRWRALHVALGLAVMLGLVHAQALVPWAAPLVAMFAIAAAALGWRVMVGDGGLSAHLYRVRKVEAPAARTVEITLEPCAGSLAVAPGQFVLVAFHDGEHYHGCGEFHPFTVSAIQPGGALGIAVKALGSCTERVQHIEPGVLARVQGPFGDFLAASVPGPQLWIAGGIGIAPFVAALRSAPLHQPTTLIYLFRSESDAAFLAELREHAAADALLELIAVPSGDQAPRLEPLLDRIGDLSSRHVQLCGPAGLLDLALEALRRRGVPPGSIHYERFDLRR